MRGELVPDDVTEGVVFGSLVNLYKAMGGGWVVDAQRITAAELASKAGAGAR